MPANDLIFQRLKAATPAELTAMAAVLGEELIGEPAGPGKRGPTPKWQQKVVMEMLDGLLVQASR